MKKKNPLPPRHKNTSFLPFTPTARFHDEKEKRRVSISLIVVVEIKSGGREGMEGRGSKKRNFFAVCRFSLLLVLPGGMQLFEIQEEEEEEEKEEEGDN